ncbi:CGNR zinc finger domain-containing protein [Kribbella sp. CA-293567]|uniref:CGNR zinc finger domain-containing protein n=1 Tax=Kribbella sp. CA-293567 TaxID=3002436 RepID=UPI0022DE67CE|nr:ABATE domain-containing protein [Kribbella sp. CA-293567]WBQ04487.1 ABATE domain-containing protein [Kribbella sp. CA-293567]
MENELTWAWLEGYPSLDFANTVIRRGWTEYELVSSVDDLASWLGAAALPAPRPAEVTAEDLEAFLRLRDPALRLLRAAAGQGSRLEADVQTLNETLLGCPEVMVLGDEPGSVVSCAVGSPDAFTLLLARLAGAVRDVLAGPRSDLAFCDAPGCGQLFFQRRTNQAWCGPACGNRARVARHHTTSG